jgi:hypothetical protein
MMMGNPYDPWGLRERENRLDNMKLERLGMAAPERQNDPAALDAAEQPTTSCASCAAGSRRA